MPMRAAGAPPVYRCPDCETTEPWTRLIQIHIFNAHPERRGSWVPVYYGACVYVGTLGPWTGQPWEAPSQ